MSTFFEIGMMIGGYRVMRALAKGGMGCVYEVEHEKLGVRYALKTFTLDRGCAVDLLRQRFLVEGKVLARMRHPNLVRVYDLGIDEATKTPYFVMDLILDKAGRSLTLDDIRPGKVDESTLVRWFGELASALDYIHEKGIVHRDIKTSNILVDEFGSVMLADFGISRYIGDDLRAQLDVKSKLGADGRPLESTMQLVLGTRAFMAPEVKAGRAATAASDAYSLGLVFFWMLTGVWPTGKIGQFDMLKGFEHDWWGVLPWLLNEAPHLRPPTLTETARMLKACRQESAVRTEPDVVRLSAEAANDKLWIRDWMPFLRKSAAVGVALGVAVGVYMATTRYPMILDAGVIGIAAVAVCALFGIMPGSRTGSTVPAGEKSGAPSRPAPAHRPVAMLDCPYCGGPMQLETELEDGRRVRCPHCNGKSVYEASRRVLTELRPPEPIRVPPEAIVERRRERVSVTSSKPTAKAERPNRDDRSRLQRIPSVAYGFQR